MKSKFSEAFYHMLLRTICLIKIQKEFYFCLYEICCLINFPTKKPKIVLYRCNKLSDCDTRNLSDDQFLRLEALKLETLLLDQYIT